MKFKNSRYSRIPFPLLRISSQDNTRKLNFCFIKNEILSILFFFFFFSFESTPGEPKKISKQYTASFYPIRDYTIKDCSVEIALRGLSCR